MMHVPTNVGVRAEPNVIPMIDIMLVLLIVFMLAMTAQYQALLATLPPESRHGEAHGAPEHLVLEVGTGGRYALDGRAVPADSLVIVLRQLFDAGRDRVILVRGDADARYQEIVNAIDLAQGAGVESVGLWTRRR